jgi:hypothetical protein
MKKVLAIVALVAAMFVAGNVQAQNMIYAGYAPETFAYSNSSTNYQGLFVGFTKNIGISHGFGVAAGAQFRMNMRNASELNGTAKAKSTQAIIDVPVLFNYPISINRDFSIAPFVGPMLSLGVVGNTKTYLGDTQLTNSDWYGDNSNMNRFNIYAVFGADVKFSTFNVFGGYRLGLMDIDKSDYVTLKTNGLFVGIGMNF